jgi:Tfp pilus assembly protein PilO
MPAMPTLKTQIAWFTRIQWLLAGCVALTAIAFYGMVYRPETTRLAGLTTTIGQRERELTAAQLQARVMQQVQEDINQLNQKLKDFKKLPANPGDLGQFQIDISQLARRDNVHEPSMSYSGMPKRDQQLSQLPISMKFDGDFSSVFAFLCDMEKLSRLTRVQSMIVKSPNSDGTVHVELVMNLYYSEG